MGMYVSEQPAAQGTECQGNAHAFTGSEEALPNPYFRNHSVLSVSLSLMPKVTSSNQPYLIMFWFVTSSDNSFSLPD